MYKEVLQNIEGIATYPIISLIIFFTFFVITCIVWFRKDKKIVDGYAQIPLSDSDSSKNN